MDTQDDDQDLDDSCILPTISPKEAFQATVILDNYLLQRENSLPNVMSALQNIKHRAESNLGTKKKQTNLETYFVKS